MSYIRFSHRQAACPICKTTAVELVGISSFRGDGQEADQYTYRFDNNEGVAAEHLTAATAPRVPTGRSVFIAMRCAAGHDFRLCFDNKGAETDYYEVVLAADLEKHTQQLLADNEPPG